MRKLLLLLLVAIPAFGYELTDSSRDYALRIVPHGKQYEVSVIDRQLSKRVAHWDVTATREQPAKVSARSGNRQFKLSLGPLDDGVIAKLDVAKDGIPTRDGFFTYWNTTKPEALATEPRRVGGEVKAPFVIHRVDPQYTDLARTDRIEGIVIVEVIIDRSGIVRMAKILKPLPDGLDASALDAVRQWRFQPATVDGKPAPVFYNLTVAFRLK